MYIIDSSPQGSRGYKRVLKLKSELLKRALEIDSEREFEKDLERELEGELERDLETQVT